MVCGFLQAHSLPIQLHKGDEVLDLTRVVVKPSEVRAGRKKSNL